MKLIIALLILNLFFLNLQIQESDGLIINCEYENDTARDDFPAYMCISVYMVNYDNKVLESAIGEHEQDGITNADVDGLALIEMDVPILDYIPENIMEIFPKLTLLIIGLTKINRITSDDMRQFPGLKAFDSFINPITKLPGDLFKYNPELRILDFYGSMSIPPSQDDSLVGIGENIFGGLEHLTEVSFFSHFCISTNAIASTREEVMDLNQRLPVMCPYDNVPTDAPTTEGTTSTSGGSTSTSTERTTTSAQSSLLNESQKLKIFFSIIVSVILIAIGNF